MKVLGIIGGLGPESTIDYYRSLVATYQERRRDGSAPSILINSLDVNKALSLLGANRLAELTDYLANAAAQLAAAGADFGLIAANTPHIVFEEVKRRSALPLLSIVEATCDSAASFGMKRLGLFGTKFTMQGRFYPEVFSSRGIELITPDPSEQDYIHDKYVNQLLKGLFLPETRDGLLAIISRLKEHAGIEGAILAGTELPLILRDAPNPGVRFLDTARIHVERATDMLLAQT